MVSEGQIIKNKIRGAGLSITAIAKELGMSSQGFEYHLKKPKLSKDLKERVFGILKKHSEAGEIEILYENRVNHFVEPSIELVSKRLNKDDKQDYIRDPLIKSVLTMGMLLKMTHEQLIVMLSEETNAENFKLIQEVISTKRELEHLREQNETLKKLADSLEKQIRK